jgi:hypothetical protein
VFKLFFPESWSTEEKLSAAVLYGGSFAMLFSAWSVLRTVSLDCAIDAMSINLYVLASASGIGTFTFGTWMVFRRIGFVTFRWLSFVFGVIGISVWPVIEYVCG